ncbi:MAG: hypothetical protein KJP04_00400 [Arenicella sp.]|nr:hypothetical protein [Arenicella sp.]
MDELYGKDNKKNRQRHLNPFGPSDKWLGTVADTPPKQDSNKYNTKKQSDSYDKYEGFARGQFSDYILRKTDQKQ